MYSAPSATPARRRTGSPAVAERRAAALAAADSDGTGDDSSAAPEPDGGEALEGPANGNGHNVSTSTEGEGDPEPANGGRGGEDSPPDPSLADAIEAMNAVPTADAGPPPAMNPMDPARGENLSPKFAAILCWAIGRPATIEPAITGIVVTGSCVYASTTYKPLPDYVEPSALPRTDYVNDP